MKKILIFKSNDFIYLHNSPALKCYLVNKGQVVLMQKGMESITVEKGNMFGIYSMINGSLRRESAVAKTYCEVCEMDKDDLTDLILKNEFDAKSVITQLIILSKTINGKIESNTKCSDDNIPEKIYNAIVYFINNKHEENAYQLLDKLKTSYTNSPYYQKAVLFLNEQSEIQAGALDILNT
ncbi:MAG: cyclic nucleotide-binding domain-containing protein [Bacillota bacterium]